jgi:leucyl aminopeptidase
MLLSFLMVSLVWPSMAVNPDPTADFQILAKNQWSSASLNPALVIHETDRDWILSSPLTNFVSYDYYFLQLPEDPADHSWFFEQSRVVAEKPGEFLIVEIRNDRQLLAVAGEAHKKGHHCGMLQKLSPQPIRMQKEQAQVKVGKVQDAIAKATRDVNVERILQTMRTMVSWETRFESDPKGVQAGEKLQALYQELIPEGRDDVTVELVTHQGSEQKSLVVRIQGQERPDEIVILGSHIDSIARGNNHNAPGADDNASGTSTNMEVFRVLMENNYHPATSIEIHGYAAEEIGLVGSKEMAEEYRRTNKNVLSMVQFDMNAYANNHPKITFVSNGTDSSLNRQLQDLVSHYNSIPAATGFLMFGSSDHAAWAGQGFPVAFPTEDPFGFNRKIHTPDDTLANINSPKQIEEFGKLGVAYLMDFSD